MADAISTLSKNGSDELNNTIAIGSCNREQDIKAEHLITVLADNSNKYQYGLASVQFQSPSSKDTFKEIATYQASGKNITIISSDYVLQKELISFLGGNYKNIKFVELGDAASKIEKTTLVCPNRLSI